MAVREQHVVESARQAADYLARLHTQREDVVQQRELIHSLCSEFQALHEATMASAEERRSRDLAYRRMEIDNRRYQEAAAEIQQKLQKANRDFLALHQQKEAHDEELKALRAKVVKYRQVNRVPIGQCREMLLDTREVIDHLHDLSNANVLGVPQGDMARMANVLERQWAWAQRTMTWAHARQIDGWEDLIKTSPKPEFVWKGRTTDGGDVWVAPLSVPHDGEAINLKQTISEGVTLAAAQSPQPSSSELIERAGRLVAEAGKLLLESARLEAKA